MIVAFAHDTSEVKGGL